MTEPSELREACKKALGATFARFLAPADGSNSRGRNAPPTVEHPLEYTFFEYIETFNWAVNISGINNEHSLSDLKASMVTNTFVNPPGFSHKAAKRARLSV